MSEVVGVPLETLLLAGECEDSGHVWGEEFRVRLESPMYWPARDSVEGPALQCSRCGVVLVLTGRQ